MPGVNPEILRWARETAGFTLEEASHRLGIKKARGNTSVERLEMLEAGDTEPTRPMLLKMANKYRRPLIVFYMEDPPRKEDREQDFRTLPEGYSDADTALVDALIRNIQVRQSILRSVFDDDEEIEPLTFVGSINLTESVEAVVESIKSVFEIDLDDFREQPNPQTAFKYLRGQVEKMGVFVLLIGDLGSHHSALDLDVFRGFAISDDIAPFIVINDKDSRAAWSFTLIHELTHIWLGQTGISSTISDLEIEQFCNLVASELLLPEVDLNSLDIDNVFDFQDRLNAISNFANEQNLSSSMVAYKLYLLEKIDRPNWIKMNLAYKKFWLEARDQLREKRRGKKGGPSYYTTRRHRLGDHMISLVHQMILGGSLTTLKAGKVLGVSPKNVQNLIEPRVQPNRVNT